MNNVLYITGLTEDLHTLIGGVWRMHHQEGFPLELSYITVKQSNFRIDWVEAMADASLDNNLHVLVKNIEVFLPEKEVTILKTLFAYLVRDKGMSYEDIMVMKKESAKNFETNVNILKSWNTETCIAYKKENMLHIARIDSENGGLQVV